MKRLFMPGPVGLVKILAAGMLPVLPGIGAEFPTNSIGIELAAVPAGSFIMGEDQDGDWAERPQEIRIHLARLDG